MATKILLSDLNVEDKRILRRDLVLKGNPPYLGEPKIINFYKIVDKYVHVPLYYYQIKNSKLFVNHKYITNDGNRINFTGELREHQKDIVNECMYLYKNTSCCFINVYCGFGKTIMAVYFASIFSKLGIRTLITYPLELIQRSWKGTCSKMTDAKIYVVGESKGEIEDHNIVLCMDTRLDKIKDKSIFGHIVIDEAHLFCTTTHVNILKFTPIYITALTASYERDDGMEQMLDLLVGRSRVYREDKRLFTIYKVNTKITPVTTLNKQDMIDYASMIKDLDNNEDRNRLILDIVNSNLDDKILILTKHKLHCKLLKELIESETDLNVKILAGKIKDYEDGDIIIGTYSKCGTGFDEKEACKLWLGIRINKIILATSSKKPKQFIGRIRAEEPVIYDLVDAHGIMKKHWNLRVSYYKSINSEIKVYK